MGPFCCFMRFQVRNLSTVNSLTLTPSNIARASMLNRSVLVSPDIACLYLPGVQLELRACEETLWSFKHARHGVRTHPFRCKCAMPCNYRKNGKNAAIFHADTLMCNTNTITILPPARWFAQHAEPPSPSRMRKKQGELKKCHVKDCPTKIDQFCMSRGSDLIRPLIISSGNITAAYTCF